MSANWGEDRTGRCELLNFQHDRVQHFFFFLSVPLTSRPTLRETTFRWKFSRPDQVRFCGQDLTQTHATTCLVPLWRINRPLTPMQFQSRSHILEWVERHLPLTIISRSILSFLGNILSPLLDCTRRGQQVLLLNKNHNCCVKNHINKSRREVDEPSIKAEQSACFEISKLFTATLKQFSRIKRLTEISDRFFGEQLWPSETFVTISTHSLTRSIDVRYQGEWVLFDCNSQKERDARQTHDDLSSLGFRSHDSKAKLVD
jgi:hypothetical protein